MPWFALIGRDHPNGLENRKRTRPAHLEHMARLDATRRIAYGGALLNESGDMTGSLVILKADDLDAAKLTFAEDPYIVHGVFEEYDVIETKPVFPKIN